jgi:hypothetical protein
MRSNLRDTQKKRRHLNLQLLRHWDKKRGQRIRTRCQDTVRHDHSPGSNESWTFCALPSSMVHGTFIHTYTASIPIVFNNPLANLLFSSRERTLRFARSRSPDRYLSIWMSDASRGSRFVICAWVPDQQEVISGRKGSLTYLESRE